MSKIEFARRIAFTLIAASLFSFEPAQAQLPVSLRVSAVGGLHQAEITATAASAELGTASTNLYTAGVEIEVGTPIGLHFGAHYLRHFGDLADSFDQIPDALSLGLGANEYGVFVENRFPLMKASPVAPFLGIGAGYGRIALAQDFEVDSVSLGGLEGDVDVFRLYALGGLNVFGSLGLKARVGWMFGSIDGDELSFGQTYTLPGGEEVAFELDYGGYYASLAVSLFGF